jgi:hypothetical protein
LFTIFSTFLERHWTAKRKIGIVGTFKFKINPEENQMERIRYEPQVKAAILEAVKEARKSGKPWAATHEAAKQSGYKGTVDGLYQFIRASGLSKKRKKHKKASVVAAVKAPASPDSLSSMLEAHIQKAVSLCLNKAISALQALKNA